MENHTHFELFGLPARYEIDSAQLDAAYRELQGRVHPDRFAAASDAERRVAMQRATQANEAYQALKSPLGRAIYMLSLRGHDVRAESGSGIEPGFLAQQFEWREAIADARAAKDMAALESLLEDLATEKRLRYGLLGSLLDEPDPDHEVDDAATEVARQLLFIEKVEQEIGDGIEALEPT
jgi:molecular chaperone HscB